MAITPNARGAAAAQIGGFAQAIARGLAVRHDRGSQYMSDAFQKELAFLGIESSPAFVRAPEGNGCAERFIRTLKEAPSTCAAAVEAIRTAWAGRPEGYAEAATLVTSAQV